MRFRPKFRHVKLFLAIYFGSSILIGLGYGTYMFIQGA